MTQTQIDAQRKPIEQDVATLKAQLAQAQAALKAVKAAAKRKAPFALKLGVMVPGVGYGFERAEFETRAEAIEAMVAAVESGRDGLREVLLVVRG